MTVGLDTSVVVRLLLGEPVERAMAAWACLSEATEQDSPPPLVSDLVMAETFFALRHHYQVPEPEALQALSRLAHEVRLAATPAVKRVLPEPRTTGAGFIDRLIHAEYADLEACLLTFDKAAARQEGAHLIVG